MNANQLVAYQSAANAALVASNAMVSSVPSDLYGTHPSIPAPDAERWKVVAFGAPVVEGEVCPRVALRSRECPLRSVSEPSPCARCADGRIGAQEALGGLYLRHNGCNEEDGCWYRNSDGTNNCLGTGHVLSSWPQHSADGVRGEVEGLLERTGWWITYEHLADGSKWCWLALGGDFDGDRSVSGQGPDRLMALLDAVFNASNK